MATIFYGWWIVIVCSAMTTYSAGILYYGFTAFFNPLIEEFGWSRAATSLAFGLYRLEGGLIAPVAGYFVDRLGPRKMMTAGVMMMGLGFVLLSRVYSLWTFYAVFLFIAFANSLGFMPVSNVLVTKWFNKKRGIALGILSGGISLCGFLVPVITWIITTWGWRTAAVVAGVGMWIIGLPLSRKIRNRPEQYGLLPDGQAPGINPGAHVEEMPAVPLEKREKEYTFREAFRTRCFWILSLALVLPYMSNAALFVHEMPFLLSVGIPVNTAAFVVTGTVLMSGVGRVGFGFLSDRFRKRYLMAITIVSQCVGILIFANIRELWHVFPFIVLFGIGYGGLAPLRPGIQGEYFGTMAFGTIQGVLFGIWKTGTILGPVVAGMFFDVTGDYRMVYNIISIVTMTSALFILACKPPTPEK